MTKLQTRDEKNAPSGYVGLDASSKIVLGGDTNLYRYAADTLKTDDTMEALSYWARAAAVGGQVFASNVPGAGDTVQRFYIRADGRLNWGPGGSTGVDTNLYRSAANALTTDGALNVGGAATITGAATVGGNATLLYAYLQHGAQVGDASNQGWQFSMPSGDAVSRSAFLTKLNADSTYRFETRYDGQLSWGPGGSAAFDTNL